MSRMDRTAAVLLVLAVVWAGTVWLVDVGPLYRWEQRRMVERVLATDPNVLLTAGRSLLTSRAGFAGPISPSSADVPIPFRRLKPTRIELTTHAVELHLSDPANPFGILVFAAGHRPPPVTGHGRGPLLWVDGLWVYDDGQLEGMELPASLVRDQR